jgi:iron complex outermembrane receptor protein
VGDAVRLRPAVAVCAALAAFRCFGETPVTEFERAVVTGSHLSPIDLETALPLQVITREEIERSGVTTVEQLLARVPANINAVNPSLSINNTTDPGLSNANLRGLGSAYTLVLLNGRRLANYAFNGRSVDLNAIPLVAIDRVEVLKDGASAIYGADAIAGVINFILRAEFRGFDGSGEYAWTEAGGGNSGIVNLTAGAGRLAVDHYNVFAALTLQKEQRLAAIDREWTRPENRLDHGLWSMIGQAFPANIVDRPRQRILNPAAAAGCAPPDTVPGRVFPFYTSGGCLYDTTAVSDLWPESTRVSAFMRGTWRLTPQLDLFADALISRNVVDANLDPGFVPTVASSFGQPVYPATGPYYPTQFARDNGLSGGLLLSWRATELGPRINKTIATAQRYSIGADGQAADWFYSLAAIYSINEQENQYAGSWLSMRRALAAIRSGLINPWGPSAPEGAALLAAAVYNGTPQTAEGVTSSINAVASRELFALPAGPLAVAVGLDARHEGLSYDWDPAVLSGDSPISIQLKSISGDRDVRALFIEFGVSIATGLTAQLAVRRDDYSDFGGTTNPKVALRWQPLQSLLLRASWGTGFRAPGLYALAEPTSNAGVAAPIRDPVRCPVTGRAEDCFGVVINYSGGNANLEPETSEQWNAGVVWQPTRSLAIGVDYWNIELSDVISIVAANTVMKYYDTFSSRVVRGPVDPSYPDLPGPIVAIDSSLINLAGTQTSGLDLSFNWSSSSTPLGTFRVNLQGTYVLHWDTTADGFVYVSPLGNTAYGLPVPRWRSTLMFDWNRGLWGGTLSQVYSSGYDDFVPLADGSTRPIDVEAFSTWDLQGTYTALGGWRFAAGVRNLLDEAPHFSTVNSNGYNRRIASPLGRSYYVRVGYAWH